MDRAAQDPARSASSGAAAVARLMRPRAVAIVGISSRPGSAGHGVLANLTANDHRCDIHLVGRSGGTIDNRPLLAAIDDLPAGVDLAILTLPAAGVADAIAACARRKIGAAVIFASGFAEVGERAAQNQVAAIARDGEVALLGPNCLGYANYVDGLVVGFTGAGVKVPRIAVDRDPALAVISQSGGLGSHFRWAFEARDLPVAYTISTGNEAGLELADFIDFLVEDAATRVIVVYVEQVRHPAAFLAAAARAHARGKPILMMHPGRGARAKAATGSHTGALAGDHAVMRAHVSHAGIALFDTLDELIDAGEILARFPAVPTRGPGILTFSGAFCAIAHDLADELGLALPPLSAATEAALAPHMPSFGAARNPLDLTTQPIWQPDLVRRGAKALIDDPALGSLMISIPPGSPAQSVRYLNAIVEGSAGSSKPVVLAMLGDRMPLAPEFMALARERRIILSRSSERALTAVARVTAHGQRLARWATPRAAPARFDGLPALGSGAQPEWRAKQLLAAIGIAVPAGDLARTVDDAVAIAARVGYPVALKAQAAALAHKTEAGGVRLGLVDAAAVRRGWLELVAAVGRARPGLALDGVLVERMAAPGVELVVGAKRDPQWGPVVLVGIGGVLVEAIGDVRVLPPDLPEPAIVDELRALRAAALLDGFRGAPAADLAAVARTAALIGRLIETTPEILEIDINPLFTHARGVTAVDALIVTR